MADDFSYRLEAWNDPSNAGSHAVVIKDVPFNIVTAGQELSGYTQGTVVLDSDYPRLAEICDPANNVETLLRLFRGTDHVASFYAKYRKREWTNRSDVVLSGPDIHDALNHGTVYPFDYVSGAKSTVQADWTFGGDDTGLLENGDFEATFGTSDFEDGGADGWGPTSGSGDFAEPIDVAIDSADALTGTNSLLVDYGERHAGIVKSFDCQPGARYAVTINLKSPDTGKRFTGAMTVSDGYTVHHTNGFVYNGLAMAELGNVARNAAANGAPGGSADGTWQTINLDVTVGTDQSSFSVIIQYDHHPISTFTGSFRVDDIAVTGPGIGVPGWTGKNTTTLERSTVQVYGDTYSAHVVTSGTAAFADGLYQQIEGLVVGATYTFGGWIYHAAGVDKELTAVIRNADGIWLGSASTVVSTATWTYVGVSATMDTEEGYVDFRVKSTGSLDFYVDDTIISEGLEAMTVGEIIRRILEPMQTRGALSWLTLDFTDTLDSSGVAWTENISVRINRGRTLAQVVDLLVAYDIEWYVSWNSVDGYELQVFNRGNAGTDRTGASGSAFSGTSPHGALDTTTLAFQSPGANTVLVEGDFGLLHEGADATLQAAYGRREGYVGATEFRGALPSISGKALNDSDNRKFGIRAVYRDEAD